VFNIHCPIVPAITFINDKEQMAILYSTAVQYVEHVPINDSNIMTPEASSLGISASISVLALTGTVHDG
jgi:hypothetical protein